MAEAKPDSYETEYMGGGEALMRDRRGMPKWMHALFLLPMVLQLAVAATLFAMGNAVGFVNLAVVPLLALMWALFLYLRVTVTKEALHIQYGLFGPRIPLASIEKVEVGTYDWVAHGGFGIRRSRKGGVAYSTPGGNGKCVAITYRDTKGNEAKVTVTTDAAEELATLLRHRGAEPAEVGDAHVRVGDDTGAREREAALMAEAEAEADAMLAAEAVEKGSGRSDRR